MARAMDVHPNSSALIDRNAVQFTNDTYFVIVKAKGGM